MSAQRKVRPTFAKRLLRLVRVRNATGNAKYIYQMRLARILIRIHRAETWREMGMTAVQWRLQVGCHHIRTPVPSWFPLSGTAVSPLLTSLQLYHPLRFGGHLPPRSRRGPFLKRVSGDFHPRIRISHFLLFFLPPMALFSRLLSFAATFFRQASQRSPLLYSRILTPALSAALPILQLLSRYWYPALSFI